MRAAQRPSQRMARRRTAAVRAGGGRQGLLAAMTRGAGSAHWLSHADSSPGTDRFSCHFKTKIG